MTAHKETAKHKTKKGIPLSKGESQAERALHMFIHWVSIGVSNSRLHLTPGPSCSKVWCGQIFQGIKSLYLWVASGCGGSNKQMVYPIKDHGGVNCFSEFRRREASLAEHIKTRGQDRDPCFRVWWAMCIKQARKLSGGTRTSWTRRLGLRTSELEERRQKCQESRVGGGRIPGAGAKNMPLL